MLYYSGKNATEILMYNWFYWFDALAAFDKYLLIPYNLNTVTYSCYYGAMEVWDLMLYYY